MTRRANGERVSSSVQSLSNTPVLQEYTQLQIHLIGNTGKLPAAEAEAGGMWSYGVDC